MKMDACGQRAWYFTHIFADPKSADTLYVLNTGMFRSTDAGRTFNLLPAPHGDHHGLWLDPDHPERMITAMTAAPPSPSTAQELVNPVQPAHRAVLSCDYRQSLALLHLRRATG